MLFLVYRFLQIICPLEISAWALRTKFGETVGTVSNIPGGDFIGLENVLFVAGKPSRLQDCCWCPQYRVFKDPWYHLCSKIFHSHCKILLVFRNCGKKPARLFIFPGYGGWPTSNRTPFETTRVSGHLLLCTFYPIKSKDVWSKNFYFAREKKPTLTIVIQ